MSARSHRASIPVKGTDTPLIPGQDPLGTAPRDNGQVHSPTTKGTIMNSNAKVSKTAVAGVVGLTAAGIAATIVLANRYGRRSVGLQSRRRAAVGSRLQLQPHGSSHGRRRRRLAPEEDGVPRAEDSGCRRGLDRVRSRVHRPEDCGRRGALDRRPPGRLTKSVEAFSADRPTRRNGPAKSAGPFRRWPGPGSTPPSSPLRSEQGVPPGDPPSLVPTGPRTTTAPQRARGRSRPWPGPGSNRRPSAFQADARTN